MFFSTYSEFHPQSPNLLVIGMGFLRISAADWVISSGIQKYFLLPKSAPFEITKYAYTIPYWISEDLLENVYLLEYNFDLPSLSFIDFYSKIIPV